MMVQVVIGRCGSMLLCEQLAKVAIMEELLHLALGRLESGDHVSELVGETSTLFDSGLNVVVLLMVMVHF